MVNVSVIIQARMGSTRLPGKVMMQINRKPLLWYSINRAMKSKRISNLIVATTTLKADDIICYWCQENKVNVFRGNELNVLDRYYNCANQNSVELIVRLTADNPFCDAEIIDSLVDIAIEKQADYVSNRINNRTYPYGLDVEVFTFKALDIAWKESKTPEEKEHVTPYIMRNSDKFQLIEINHDIDLSNIRLSIDTEIDFKLCKKLIEANQADKKKWKDIVAIYDAYIR